MGFKQLLDRKSDWAIQISWPDFWYKHNSTPGYNGEVRPYREFYTSFDTCLRIIWRPGTKLFGFNIFGFGGGIVWEPRKK